ncbi:MAG: glycosyl transferase family 2 [Henriciella sp.]|jgi:hypothetical protein|uniref:glycosyltransferase n=1 Tax=uncultured Henriciella sp. TaxID=1608424 RepID=UPI000C59D4E4|nr:glycosyl transferase family 2 [Henriciella sp.]MBF33225.1 glycosyl transferase family 2 [Hyphomonadaceae bacterium]|tara:strand:- start:395 stop:1429 length:1035 start_codon:yes stop_codon:yes gene_type:complete
MRWVPPGPVAVGIPVRDEADRLPRLLDALAGQSVGANTFSVCFLLDGCSDDSEALLRAALPTCGFDYRLATSPLAEPNAGRARRQAMKMCLPLCEGPGSILLTTDADSVPEPDWIEMACRALESVDVVAGRIERTIRLMGCWRTRLEDYLDALHTQRRNVDPIAYDAVPAHPSLGGANLGFRADVYRALGGFPAFVRGEDRALVAKARREGFRVRHDPVVLVYTSNRVAGRAPGGLADELRDQLYSELPALVADPGVCLRHYRLQAALRAAFEAGPLAIAAAARRYGYCEIHLGEVAREARTADAFVEIVAPEDCLPQANVLPLPAAEAALAALTDADKVEVAA